MTEARKRPRFKTNDKLSGDYSKSELPYASKVRLLSDGERRFFKTGLLPAMGDRYHIMCKVRLTDILEVPPEHWRAAAGRKIQQRHTDFVLVTKKLLSIVAAIELDDSTHLTKEQEARDKHLGDSLFAGGVPLIRVPIYSRYDPVKLRNLINGVLRKHPLRLKGRSG